MSGQPEMFRASDKQINVALMRAEIVFALANRKIRLRLHWFPVLVMYLEGAASVTSNQNSFAPIKPRQIKISGGMLG